MPACRLEALTRRRDSLQQGRDAVEHDERSRRSERVPHVRVGVDVFRAQVPGAAVLCAHEAGGDWKSAPERLPAGDQVGEVAAPPEGARSSEPRIDLVRNEKCAGLVAALAQPLQEAVRRDLRSRSPLHRLDDDTRRVGGKRTGIRSVRAAMHRPGQPGRERAPEPLESCGREGEQAGPVVGAREGDDSRAAGDEQRCSQGDFNRVFSGDAEHDLVAFTAEPRAQICRHVCLGEVAERVHAAIRLSPDRSLDLGTSVAERGDAEASGKIDVASPVGVGDAAALCLRPDHGRSLFSVSSAT